MAILLGGLFIFGLATELANNTAKLQNTLQKESSAQTGSGSQFSKNSDQAQSSPLSFKIGAAEFTPGGFLDITSFTRTTNVGSGIGTSFGSIPYNNQLPPARLTETHLSAQNSRRSLNVHSQLGAQELTSYVETDFLGVQPRNRN